MIEFLNNFLIDYKFDGKHIDFEDKPLNIEFKIGLTQFP